MANSDINAKRKRDDSSLGRVPAMISGLTISDFGDLGRDYKDTLDRVASVYDNAASESQPEGKSLAERKYDGIATSSENISKYVSSHRRKSLKQEREGYHNRCALRHCEVPRLINNPFVEACKCSHPSRSAGDLLKRVAVLHPGPVLTLWTVGRDAGGGMGGGGAPGGGGPGTGPAAGASEVPSAAGDVLGPRRRQGAVTALHLGPVLTLWAGPGTQAAGWGAGGAEVAQVRLALRPEPHRRRSRQQVTCWARGRGGPAVARGSAASWPCTDPVGGPGDAGGGMGGGGGAGPAAGPGASEVPSAAGDLLARGPR